MKIKYEEALGVSLNNADLFTTAFTHKSYSNEHPEIECNERLEFLGDAVLELVVTDHLFTTFPELPEGVMTKYRSSLVSGKSLAETAKKLGLGDFLHLSKGEKASGGNEKNPILANVFEAVIGAIYIDSGFDIAKKFIHTHIIPQLTEILENNLHVDPKSSFQEWAQEKYGITPEYKVLLDEGPDHAKKYTVGVFLEAKKMGEGIGTSKQKGEVAAAENAMNKKNNYNIAE